MMQFVYFTPPSNLTKAMFQLDLYFLTRLCRVFILLFKYQVLIIIYQNGKYTLDDFYFVGKIEGSKLVKVEMPNYIDNHLPCNKWVCPVTSM